jgi:hypothetical protein
MQQSGRWLPIRARSAAACTQLAARIMRVSMTGTRVAAAVALLAATASCSLISLKSPEKPLSTRDLNARILTREYSARFIAAVGQSADQITAASDDSAIRLNALRWKISAAVKSQRAASQMAPMMGLLDSWALAVQMSDFLSTGGGRALFGPEQGSAVALAQELAHEAEDLGRRLALPDEFQKDKQFIETYAQAHPIESLHFARASIVDEWTRDTGGQSKLVESLGTVPEALADAGDRLRMYGEIGPELVVWQAQLAAQESGMSSTDFKSALRRFDERINQLNAMINSTPQLVNGVVRDASTRFDYSWAQMMRDVRVEETTLSGTVSAEREAAVSALDAERAALAADATRIANQVIHDTGDQVRRLVREALLLVIALTIVLLGAPFVAGYFVGRAHRR